MTPHPTNVRMRGKSPRFSEQKAYRTVGTRIAPGSVMHKVFPGDPYPLGARWDGRGTQFALYSETADRVELVLLDDNGKEECLRLSERTAFVWHGYVLGVHAGQRYAYRVHGPNDPKRGLRFDPQRLMSDPYAKAWAGPNDPTSVVIAPNFDWGGDRAPAVPFHKTLVYELHVKGFTQQHPEIPPELRGTYAGLGHPASVSYLKELGVTAIELLPVHAFVDDGFLLDKGLRNYWGYNSLAFLAPDPRYRAGKTLAAEVNQFREMVKAMHAEGIEVILDVVYNHTAEGNHMGPALSFKGIDNPTYYRLVEDNPEYYFDTTGTGNTLNGRHPQTLQLIMDSLRYWVNDMHVDGFRFDLASSLARGLFEVDRLGSFFTIIHQDPVISQVKLIAEPWDVADGGYQVGNFPVRWAEWNGKYRDTMRSFWKGDGGKAAELGYRLTGSSDLYENDGRKPYASINFITCHDGFSMRDLVSYNDKHNEANGEDNKDGSNDNASWNCGVEGPTDDPEVQKLRARQQRNMLATLLLSQGTPMLLAGDERAHSQNGNNNAYCQDNELTWLDWKLDDEKRALLELTKKLVRIRKEHPSLTRAKFFRGRPIRGSDVSDLAWFRFDGQPMSDDDWNNHHTASFCMFYAGDGIRDVDDLGERLKDDDLLILLNGSPLDLDFVIPQVRETAWTLLVDTAEATIAERKPGEVVQVIARSLQLWKRSAQ